MMLNYYCTNIDFGLYCRFLMGWINSFLFEKKKRRPFVAFIFRTLNVKNWPTLCVREFFALNVEALGGGRIRELLSSLRMCLNQENNYSLCLNTLLSQTFAKSCQWSPVFASNSDGNEIVSGNLFISTEKSKILQGCLSNQRVNVKSCKPKL